MSDVVAKKPVPLPYVVLRLTKAEALAMSKGIAGILELTTVQEQLEKQLNRCPFAWMPGILCPPGKSVKYERCLKPREHEGEHEFTRCTSEPEAEI